MAEKLKILLIEDDDSHVELIKYNLNKVKAFRGEVHRCQSLQEGEQSLAEEDFDIALVDLSYEGSSPKDTLDYVSNWLNSYELPIIILTSLEDRHMGREAIRIGFGDFLSKAKLSEELLEKTISYAIERKKISSELKASRDLALEATKAKSEFLAVMSHEIRTPLNGIICSLSLLKEMGGLTNEQQEFIDIINVSSDSLLKIINDTLDFSKIEAGKIVLEQIPFSLKNLIYSIKNIYVPLADKKGVEFLAPFPCDDCNYIGDPDKIRQVVSNIINNALKFTNDGHIHLKTEQKGTQKNYDEVTFTISDSGTGISSENLNKIFESFTQEDSSTTREYGGTGLGLTISKNLVDLMDGQLTVESELNKGTDFTIKLHLEKTQKACAHKNKTRFHAYQGRVLLVEDNLVNKTLALKVLKKFKLDVDVACNGEEAVQKCRASKYDLIFMDIMMPIMDGLTATKNIRLEDTETPIIAMTANAFERDKEKCMEVGMNGYILQTPDNKCSPSRN